ncbi:MAG: NAD(P)H-hydrate dehydratase [Pigmentiphaga sp.]
MSGSTPPPGGCGSSHEDGFEQQGEGGWASTPARSPGVGARPHAEDVALLRCRQMGRADALAIAAGTPGALLMAAAGEAVAEAVCRYFPRQPVTVLCGPGNNGGDGFVAARCLAERGWPVRLVLRGERGALSGDAAHHARQWAAPCLPWDAAAVAGAGVVIDAVFGAGLSRDLPPDVTALLQAARAQGAAVIAVDVPSGLDGDSGTLRGKVVPADVTVTFFRLKPGHLLLPGRDSCGRLELAQIGMPDAVLPSLDVDTWHNLPALWRQALPRAASHGHKYDRGHVLVLGGARMTGAARLAAAAAQRAGAGLVTVAAPTPVWPVYAAALDSIMVEPCATPETSTEASEWPAMLADTRRNVVLLGPGLGRHPSQRDHVLATFDGRRRVVLDADALSIFAKAPERLFAGIQGDCVLTPHEGEFTRLFGASTEDKPTRARRAARASGAVVVLKGSDTVIAAPDGRVAINDNAPPTLAIGGTGDALAGLVAGLLAQGMPAFEAAAAAVWLHGRAAQRVGPGLIPEDLLASLPGVWAELIMA